MKKEENLNKMILHTEVLGFFNVNIIKGRYTK